METADTLKVADICTLHAFIVNADECLEEVAMTMADKQIGSALVVEEDRLVGIFTATDACKYLSLCLRNKQ